jgi:hypothetical protein
MCSAPARASSATSYHSDNWRYWYNLYLRFKPQGYTNPSRADGYWLNPVVTSDDFNSNSSFPEHRTLQVLPLGGVNGR